MTPQTRVFDPGFYQLPKAQPQIPQLEPHGDGWVDMDLAIARSNDTYFYSLAHKMGIDRCMTT